MAAAADLAALVEESDAFLERERSGEPAVGRYRLRESGLIVFLRHGRSEDVDTLDEVFAQRFYEEPAPVREVLGDRPLRILDLGAHVGLSAAWFLGQRPGSRVTAFEPDPENADLLERAAVANGLAGDWRVVRAAAGNRDGTQPFAAGEATSSQVAEEGEDNMEVAVVDVLPLAAEADLVKIDSEGGEWPMLTDPRFASAAPRAVVLEYHPDGAPEGEPPRAAVEGILERCGYATHHLFEKDDGVGMLWAWRPG